MMDPSTDQQAEAELPLVHEEQKMFEPLCERLLCAVSNLQSSLSEMLDLKDELISLGLPSSLTSRLSISAGRLFRSVSDLSVPSMELVRLVQVHSTPWEQKKQILEKLHRNYERKQSYLSLAIRRLQVLEAQSRSVARYQRIGNWERLFAKLMSAQGVGQRWKLRVEALRRTAMSGDMPELAIENLQQPQDVDIISHPHESEGSMAFSERNTPVKTLSDYIGADFAQEDEEETQRRSVESNRASQSPVSEDGNAPLFIETQETGAQTEIETEERETWTGESMTHRFLCVSVSPVLGGSGKGFSCRLTYGQQTHHVKLPALPTPRPPQPLPLTKKITIQEKGSVLATRKTPAAAPTRGVGTPYRDNPPGILRRGASSPRIESTLEINSDEVRFELSSCGQTKEILMNLALYHEAEGITATGEVPIPSDVPEALTIKVPLLGAGARSRSPYATLDLNLHHEEEVLPRWRDKATQAWSVHDVVREATGIDLHLTSPADLQRMLQPSPEVLEASTSPFPLPPEPLCQDSSTSPMPGPRHCLPEEAVSRPETDYQQDQSLLQEMVGELTSLHRIPERELQMLLNTLNPSSRSPAAAELLQQITPTQAVIDGRSDDAVKRYWAEEPPILEPDSGISKSAGAATRSRRKPVNGKDISRSLLLRKALPTDVWQRMQHLEEVMQKNKQNTLEKLRSVSSESLERQLNSQRRIHAPSEKDTGCQDDVCLPALFMPTKLGHLFSPKAHLYFHPSGSGATLRLTQPPSMLSLPPLSGQNKLSVLNLLDPGVSLPSYSGRRRSGKNAWADSTQWKEAPTALSKGVREPPNGKDLYGQLQGGALEDTGDQLKGSQLVEKIVGDDLVINEAFPALEKDVAETPVGKKLLQKINGPELTDSISPVGKYAGEALVDTHVLDYVA